MHKTVFLDASQKCSMCVLPHEFCWIHLHGFVTSLPRFRLGLVNAASASVSVSWKLPHPHHWLSLPYRWVGGGTLSTLGQWLSVDGEIVDSNSP